MGGSDVQRAGFAGLELGDNEVAALDRSAECCSCMAVVAQDPSHFLGPDVRSLAVRPIDRGQLQRQGFAPWVGTTGSTCALLAAGASRRQVVTRSASTLSSPQPKGTSRTATGSGGPSRRSPRSSSCWPLRSQWPWSCTQPTRSKKRGLETRLVQAAFSLHCECLISSSSRPTAMFSARVRARPPDWPPGSVTLVRSATSRALEHPLGSRH